MKSHHRRGTRRVFKANKETTTKTEMPLSLSFPPSSSNTLTQPPAQGLPRVNVEALSDKLHFLRDNRRHWPMSVSRRKRSSIGVLVIDSYACRVLPKLESDSGLCRVRIRKGSLRILKNEAIPTSRSLRLTPKGDVHGLCHLFVFPMRNLVSRLSANVPLFTWVSFSLRQVPTPCLHADRHCSIIGGTNGFSPVNVTTLRLTSPLKAIHSTYLLILGFSI